MKGSGKDRLLGEVFADENVERLRASSLAGGLAVLRARRRRRVWISGAATSLAVGIAVVLSLRRPDSINVVAPPADPPRSSVKIISDEQLLSLFPNRSVALIGRPGEQRLVFFAEDEPQAKANEP